MEKLKSLSWIRELEVHYLVQINSVKRFNFLLKQGRFSILLVDSGRIDFSVEGKEIGVAAGHIYAVPLLAKTETLTKDVRLCLITCSTSFAFNSAISKFGSGYIDFAIIHRGTLLSLEPKEKRQLLTIIALLKQNANFRKQLPLQDEKIVLCFNLLLYEFGLLQCRHGVGFSLRHSRKERLVINFISLLKQHCSQQHSVKFYADLLFVSAGYLSKAIREVTNTSAKHFIELAILSEAYILLANENLTISDISIALNFTNSSTFSNFFKRYGKMSPTQYRLTLGYFVQDQPTK
ncbi:helix-turn-helix domain-containing protein [Flavobacterium sp.]|uniref:helix-turn-helix domain-containing protein n=1 Tax=Flavobacterium sp. TaxID=239 RepID=UPI0040349C6D